MHYEVFAAGGLVCTPGADGGETEQGNELILTASTMVYGSMVPSLHWYDHSDNALDVDVFWDDQNITKTYVVRAVMMYDKFTALKWL